MESDSLSETRLKLKISIENTDVNSDEETHDSNIFKSNHDDDSSDNDVNDVEFNVRLDKHMEYNDNRKTTSHNSESDESNDTTVSDISKHDTKDGNEGILDDDEKDNDVEFNVRLGDFEKKKPNEDIEDGVNQDVQAEVVPEKIILPPKVYKNKVEEFLTGLNQTNEEIRAKRTNRAKRFGIQRNKEVTFVDVNYLYRSLEMSDADLTDDKIAYRLNTINLRGVDNLSTDEVFAYFKDIPASTIEWINDTTCNVVWVDSMNCARAMYRLSRDREEVIQLAADMATSPSTHGDKSPNITHVEETKGDGITEKSATPDPLPDDYDELDLCDEGGDKNKEITMDVDGANIPTNSEKPNIDNVENVVTTEHPRMEGSESDELPTGITPSHITTDTTTTDTTQPDTIDAIQTDQVAAHNSQPDTTVDADATLVTDDVSMEVDTPRHDVTEDVSLFAHMNLSTLSWPIGAWRLGVPCPRTKALFMRFATKDDVKLQGAEKRSKYYQYHGNPNYGGLKGLISGSRKRKFVSQTFRKLRDGNNAEKGRTQPDYSDNYFDDSEPDTQLIYEETAADQKDVGGNQIEERGRENVDGPAGRLLEMHEDHDRCGDSDDELERLLGRSRTKRFMRMHADDVVDHSRTETRGSQKGVLTVTTKPRSNLSQRLGHTRNKLSADLRARLGPRK